jgi:hypothetical protein
MLATGANDFDINVYKKASWIKIVYFFRDSTSEEVYPLYREKDWLFWHLKDKDSIANARKELDSLWQKYSYYSSDSLEFSIEENIIYSDLLSLMFTAENCDFRNQTPRIIMCDGYSVSVSISSRKHFLKIGARSPNYNSYPLLTRFLTETIRVGLNSHCYQFLKTKTTYIYP